MKQTLIPALLLSTTMLAGTALAEGVYGSADLSTTWQKLRFDGERNEETGIAASGYLGYRFGTAFVEGELRHQDMSDDLDDEFDPLQHGTLGALRGGMDFGAVNAELVFGGARVTTDEGRADLTFAGIGGGYSLSDQLALRGMFLHLARASGEQAEDVIKDANAVSFGAAYGLSDKITLTGDAVYADGVTDSEREMALVREITLGLDHAFAAPGWNAYGRISYADFYQGSEEDSVYDTRVTLGITYSFGAEGRGRDRAVLPNIENWMAVTASVLE